MAERWIRIDSKLGTVTAGQTRRGSYSMKRGLLVVLACIVLAVLVSGCGASEEVSKSQTPLEAGTGAKIGTWEVAGGVSEVTFTKEITKHVTADRGYVFALVPFSLKNASNSTASFSRETWNTWKWKLSDNNGFEYDVDGTAAFFLEMVRPSTVPPSLVPHLTDVPPGATRTSLLVFQIKEGPQSLILKLQTSKESIQWKVN